MGMPALSFNLQVFSLSLTYIHILGVRKRLYQVFKSNITYTDITYC